jgi:hypothetical protein
MGSSHWLAPVKLLARTGAREYILDDYEREDWQDSPHVGAPTVTRVHCTYSPDVSERGTTAG